MVTIYTDGACDKARNGGWAFVADRDGIFNIGHGGGETVTSNQMELAAAIHALEWCTNLKGFLNHTPVIVIHTDSQYLQKGITEWVTVWKLNGWKTKTGQPVQNKYLWTDLDHRVREWEGKWKVPVTFNWTPRNSTVGGLLADNLAVARRTLILQGGSWQGVGRRIAVLPKVHGATTKPWMEVASIIDPEYYAGNEPWMTTQGYPSKTTHTDTDFASILPQVKLGGLAQVGIKIAKKQLATTPFKKGVTEHG